MNDRELLELAAKAMLDSGDPNFRNYEVYADRVCLELGSRRGAIIGYWKPLTDDGDALRLAVRLRMNVDWESADCVWCDNEGETVEGDDPYAATRRAIVRAAAELGRSKT
jgi:hypothetical protein